MPHTHDESATSPSGPFTVRIPQAGQLLGVGRSTIYELINSGELETIKLGRSTLIVTASIRSFVERRRRTHQGNS